MEELIRMLDKGLEYKKHEIKGDKILIYTASKLHEMKCPYCGEMSSRVHSRSERRFNDLPIQGKKVEIIINHRKMFCVNAECKRKTFSERFEFLPYKGKRSNRLTNEIIKVSSEVSSVTASRILRNGVADVGKSTICKLLKKRGTPHKKNRSKTDMH
jgi:transposase